MEDSYRKLKTDLQPDVSIYKKIGQKGYSFNDAISELIDNSIDAATPGKPVIVKIDIGKDGDKIIIEDNASGMNQLEVEKALVLAHSLKKDKLGVYGLGMKGACSSLGSKYTIITKKSGNSEEFILQFDEDKFQKDGKWKDFEYTAKKSDRGRGTTIIIENIKRDLKIYYNKITYLKDALATRYAPFLKEDNLRLAVSYGSSNYDWIRPQDPEFIKKYPIRIKFNGQSITGELGYTKTGNLVYNGIDLFKNHRLIKAYVQEPFWRNHPDFSHFRGHLNLDNFETTYSKDSFMEDLTSETFIELGKALKPRISEIKREISDLKQRIRDKKNKKKAIQRSTAEKDRLQSIERDMDELRKKEIERLRDKDSELETQSKIPTVKDIKAELKFEDLENKQLMTIRIDNYPDSANEKMVTAKINLDHEFIRTLSPLEFTALRPVMHIDAMAIGLCKMHDKLHLKDFINYREELFKREAALRRIVQLQNEKKAEATNRQKEIERLAQRWNLDIN